MEPRPPRPRSPQPGFPGAGGPAGGRGAGAPAYPPGAPDLPYGAAPGAYGPLPGAPLAVESPLLNRQERRRQRILRGVLAFVLGLAVLVGLGWTLRDRLLPGTTGPAAAPPVAQENQGQGQGPTPIPPDTATLASPAPAESETASLLATATPTPPPAAAPTSAPQPTPAAIAPTAAAAAQALDPADTTIPLTDFLPSEDEIPGGLAPDGPPAERSLQEVLDQLGGTDEAAALLSDWGWEGNAYQNFSTAAEEPPGTTTFLSVSVHRFADEAAADNALTFFSEYYLSVDPGMADIELEPVGDAMRALGGAPQGTAFTVLYVRDGPLMYRIGGSSNTEDGDPAPEVTALARSLISG